MEIENMVPDSNSYGAEHAVTVGLNVGGGSGGAGWYSSTISADAFGEAVHLSLEKTTLFQKVVQLDTADYQLDVTMTYAGSHPGFAMTGWVNASWTLLDRASGRTAWSAEIKGEGGSGAFEHFSGAARQMRAMERATKANIEQALTEIGKLNLQSP